MDIAEVEAKLVAAEKHIANVLSGFDFDKVHKAMVAVDWKWGKDDGVGLETPTVAGLVKTARWLLELACKEKATVRTGGFHAWYDEGTGIEFGLMFVLESNDADYVTP